MSRGRSGSRRAGRCKLRFVNNSRATLSFSAPRLLPRRAAARRATRDAVAGGRFRLAPGERRTSRWCPAPGRYRARSANLVHRLLGMSAEIVVE